MKRIPLACVTVGAVIFTPLHAATTTTPTTVTTPAAALASDSNAGNRFPFDPYDTSSMRYQQAYASSFFTGVSADPVLITELRFRCDAGPGATSGPFSTLISDIKIAFSTTSRPAESLLNTFAENIGQDVTIVVPRGPLALSSGYANSSNGTKVFDISIIFQTPFLYNPLLGNLLMDVTNYSGTHLTTSNYIAFDASNSSTDGISRVYSGSSMSGIGTVQSLGLVTQFVIQSVPEPSVVGLLGLASVVGLIRRRR